MIDSPDLESLWTFVRMEDYNGGEHGSPRSAPVEPKMVKLNPKANDRLDV